MVRCFRCGRSGHYSTECFASTTKRGRYIEDDDDSDDDGMFQMQCFRCGREGHLISSCFAKTSKNGAPLPVAKKPRLPDRDTRPRLEESNKGVYVLESGDGLFYVGKSNNIPARIEQHRTGDGGAAFSQMMGSFKAVPPLTPGSADDLESWERNETLQRMWTHGIDKVRGWMFTSPHMTEEQKQAAFGQVCEKFDLCRKCGRTSHFASACYARGKEAWAN